MRKLATVLSLVLLLAGTTLQAQKTVKIGHIDSQALLENMPERTEAMTKLEAYRDQLAKQLQAMSTEYELKLKEYQDMIAKGTMTDPVKKVKEQEIVDLDKRIQEFSASAQKNLQEKEVELLTPIFDKAKDAVNKVAKANGFTYILDSSKGGPVIFHEDGEDVMPLVRKELGITTAGK